MLDPPHGPKRPIFFTMGVEYHNLLKKIEQILTPVLKNLGVELVEREFVFEHGRRILRLYIERDGTSATLDDCSRVSKGVEGVLDVEDLIPPPYVLEVSSPGIDRPLRKKKDFERFRGKWVDVRTKELVQGRRHFSGVLQEVEGDEIVVLEGGQEWRVPLDQLKKAKLKRSIKS